ncbi:hypothetical protein B0O99DRAFT_741685 [Bisporella sp. PMI_857]|nr:hypothetical protein B0O99DRAFT_741685 [Bisporella sp. PMI_857]
MSEPPPSQRPSFSEPGLDVQGLLKGRILKAGKHAVHSKDYIPSTPTSSITQRMKQEKTVAYPGVLSVSIPSAPSIIILSGSQPTSSHPALSQRSVPPVLSEQFMARYKPKDGNSQSSNIDFTEQFEKEVPPYAPSQARTKSQQSKDGTTDLDRPNITSYAERLQNIWTS